MSDGYVILDASALIALLLKEPGHELVARVVAKSVMSAVNVAEAAKILVEKQRLPEGSIKMVIEGLVGEIIPFDADDAYLNATLIPKTKKLGLSLGDRACVALGVKSGYPVYTADKEWSKLDCDCKIIQIR